MTNSIPHPYVCGETQQKSFAFRIMKFYPFNKIDDDPIDFKMFNSKGQMNSMKGKVLILNFMK